MEISFHITCCHSSHYRSFSTQLGLLDNPYRNSIVHEERAAFQYQTKRSFVSPPLFRDDVHELDFESIGRLAEQQTNSQSRILEETFQHNWFMGTHDRSYCPGVYNQQYTRSHSRNNRRRNQRCHLFGLPN